MFIRYFSLMGRYMVDANQLRHMAHTSAESQGNSNELVVMCDIHLHEILMRAEVCCQSN